MEKTKICKKCGKELPIECFSKCKRNKDGLQCVCKECFKQYNAEHRDEHREKMKQWHAEHRDERKQYKKQYYARHRDEHREKMKQWYAEHRDEHIEYMKQYYTTIEGYARSIRKSNLQQDRKYGRCGKDEDPLPSIEEYIELLQQPDFYDGKQYHWSEMGVDRIDNNKPHTIDNVVPCTTEHNVQRQKMSFEEFCELMQN